jgi:hypothetical protein
MLHTILHLILYYALNAKCKCNLINYEIYEIWMRVIEMVILIEEKGK